MPNDEVAELKHIQNFQFKYGEDIISQLKEINRKLEVIVNDIQSNRNDKSGINKK